jgi:hypothetical protein
MPGIDFRTFSAEQWQSIGCNPQKTDHPVLAQTRESKRLRGRMKKTDMK